MLIFLFGLFLIAQAGAEEAAPAKTYSGDFWTRSTLTGDWGGLRNDLAEKGVTFDMSLTQVGIGLISGGKDTGWEYSGRGNITINMDTQKLGLWPGGFLTVEAEGNYNKSINNNTGALSPANSNQLYPTPGHDNLNIPAVTYMQFLSHYFGVVFGKLDTTSGDANEFAHGKGDTQFFNLSLSFNPVYLLTAPNSALGAGVIILPTQDPDSAIITASVIDSNGQANRSGFDTAFEGNDTYAIEGRVRTNFFGMTGHQLVGATYSSKNFTSLSQNTRLSLKGIVQSGQLSIQQVDNSWSVYYNFDQYLYEPSKGHGIGIFGRFGASDGEANPAHYFYSLGIGGKGLITSRPNDAFGIGYYYIDVANPTLTGIFKDRQLLRDEYGVEAYYNIAITPWMKLTPDFRVIRPAQKQEIGVGLSPRDIFGRQVLIPTVVKNDINTAVSPASDCRFYSDELRSVKW